MRLRCVFRRLHTDLSPRAGLLRPARREQLARRAEKCGAHACAEEGRLRQCRCAVQANATIHLLEFQTLRHVSQWGDYSVANAHRVACWFLALLHGAWRPSSSGSRLLEVGARESVAVWIKVEPSPRRSLTGRTTGRRERRASGAWARRATNLRRSPHLFTVACCRGRCRPQWSLRRRIVFGAEPALAAAHPAETATFLRRIQEPTGESRGGRERRTTRRPLGALPPGERPLEQMHLGVRARGGSVAYRRCLPWRVPFRQHHHRSSSHRGPGALTTSGRAQTLPRRALGTRKRGI